MTKPSQPKVFLLGRVTLEVDGAAVEERGFAGRQGRLLFAYLVSEAGRPVPRDEIAEVLWGGDQPATWDKALTVLASKVRGVLAGLGVDGALTGAFGCYRLELPPGTWVDVVVAAEATEKAEAALRNDEPARAKAEAARAEPLLRETFLPGENGDWVEARRRGLADLRVRAIAVLADASLQLDDSASAVVWAEQAVALDPFRESAYRRLIEAHAAAGDRAEALRVYDRYRRLVAEELGAYPSPETEALYRTLLESPSAPEAAVAEPQRPTSRRRRGGRPIVAVLVLAAGTALAAVMLTRSAAAPPRTVAANAVGLLDARGRIGNAVAPLRAAPTAIAYGRGAVWVAEADADVVERVDPTTFAVRQTIDVGHSPSGIAAGGGGVWVANHDDGTVAWINPTSNAVVREIGVGHDPTAVVVGYGSVWVTNSANGTVSRIDAATGEVTAPAIRTGAVGRGIAVGGGSVWVTDEAGQRVVRIDPKTNAVAGSKRLGSGPGAIAYGGGAVWIADALDDTVSKLDPETLQLRAAVPVSGGPDALAFSRGSLWAASEFGQQIVEISPAAKRTAAFPVDDRPAGLAASPLGVWMGVRSSGRGHYGGRLVVADGGRLDSIDPTIANTTASWAIVGVAYDGLTAFRRTGGSAGSELVPDLARALPTPSDGGRSYTFRLRRGIRFSDGRPLRAADFRRALARMRAVRSHWLDGNALDDVTRVVVHGTDSLTFRLSRPDRRFLSALVVLVPVPPGTPFREIGTHPIPTTGPYAIGSYVRPRGLVFVRNRYFHVWSQAARPNGYPDEIVWRFTRTTADAVRQVLDGRVDVVPEDVPATEVNELAARYPGRLHFVPERATAFVFLNTRTAPFDDVRVRRALNYAVDRRQLAEAHGGAELATPTCQILPPTLVGYRRFCPYTAAPDVSGTWKAPNLARARALIAASGTRGERVVLWTFPYFASEGQQFTALLNTLGYRATLRSLDGAAYFRRITADARVQAGFVGWFGALNPVDALVVLRCDFPDNWARFCDHRVDRQVARLATKEARDPTAGGSLAARIDRELVDAAPWVPVFTPSFADFVSARVGDYMANTYTGATVLLDQLWVR
jgi:peptide/nickel transport system substrate-binding protein